MMPNYWSYYRNYFNINPPIYSMMKRNIISKEFLEMYFVLLAVPMYMYMSVPFPISPINNWLSKVSHLPCCQKPSHLILFFGSFVF